ncbi:MAG: putative quinol monooxygenase [Promethearchaeota archaeon]
MTITLIATITIRKGMMEDAKKALKEGIPKVLANEPGLLEYAPHTVAGEGNENIVIFYEIYKDQEAQKIHTENQRKFDFMRAFGRCVERSVPVDLKFCSKIL